MPTKHGYRLYFMVGNHISRATEFFAEDDAEALGIARNRAINQPVELWERSRCVARLSPFWLSPLAPEPLSGLAV